MKKNWQVIVVAAWLLFGCALCAFAGVPVRWSVETSRADVQNIECYHGEQLDIEVAFKSYGQPLELPLSYEPKIFWQTNGMAAYFWQTNNVEIVSNTIMRTQFLPGMDVGTHTVFGFIGVPEQIYRAAFVLRFKNSPGADPLRVEWPYRELDFDKVQVVNAPYYTKREANDRFALGNEVILVAENERGVKVSWDEVEFVRRMTLREGVTIGRTNYGAGGEENLLLETPQGANIGLDVYVANKSEEAASGAEQRAKTYADQKAAAERAYTTEATNAVVIYADGATGAVLRTAKSYTDEKTEGLIGASGGEIYGELNVAVLSAGIIQNAGTIEVGSIELNGENVEQNYAKKTYVDNAMETATEEALARFELQKTQIDANAEAGTNYVNSATGAVAKIAGRYATATAQVTRTTQDGITLNSIAAKNWAGSVVEIQTEGSATNAALTIDLTGMETGLMSDVVLEVTNATGAACAVGVVGAEVWRFDGDEATIASNRLAVVTVTVLPSEKRLVAVREVTR